MPDDEKSNQIKKLSDKRFGLIILILGAIMITIATYLIDDLFRDFGLPYPENLHTLVIEIGIGVIITLLIYSFSTQQQQKLTRIVTDIKKLEQQQQSVLTYEKERINRWKHEWGSLILTELEAVNRMYGILETWLIDYWKNPTDEQRSNLPLAAKRNVDILKYNFQNIHKYVPHIKEHFDDPKLGVTLTNVSTSTQFTVLFEVLDQDWCWELNSQGAFDSINDKRRVINDLIDKVKKEISNDE